MPTEIYVDHFTFVQYFSRLYELINFLKIQTYEKMLTVVICIISE